MLSLIIAIDYRRAEGHFLGSHCDDRQLSGGLLLNLCLAGDAIMTYNRDAKGSKNKRGQGALQECYNVHLPRRALQIQSGTVRYDFQHQIRNEDLLSPRRVSITFRQNISGISGASAPAPPLAAGCKKFGVFFFRKASPVLPLCFLLPLPTAAREGENARYTTAQAQVGRLYFY